MRARPDPEDLMLAVWHSRFWAKIFGILEFWDFGIWNFLSRVSLVPRLRRRAYLLVEAGAGTVLAATAAMIVASRSSPMARSRSSPVEAYRSQRPVGATYSRETRLDAEAACTVNVANVMGKCDPLGRFRSSVEFRSHVNDPRAGEVQGCGGGTSGAT